MTPARWPRPDPLEERLLVIDPQGGVFHDARVRDLPEWLHPGDLLVVNDAATLPASLAALSPSGRPMEVRLVGELPSGRWRAVLFGEGDWRIPTESRPAPEPLTAGQILIFGPGPTGGCESGPGQGVESDVSEGGRATSGAESEAAGNVEPGLRGWRDAGVTGTAEERLTGAAKGESSLQATIEEVSSVSPRLVDIRFSKSGSAFWSALYRIGRPVQYSYVENSLSLWHVQTAYAARPWAAEPPSAGRPLTWGLLRKLAGRGVRLTRVTHAAGLSSTGDPAIDAALPLAERYDIPAETVRAVEETRSNGGHVSAVGTTVVRALEGCARNHGGSLTPGSAFTDLVIGPGYEPLVVDGLLTGLHEPAASHYGLIHAFAPPGILSEATLHAEVAGYLHHEFGDSCLILPRPETARRLPAA